MTGYAGARVRGLVVLRSGTIVAVTSHPRTRVPTHP
jgi:hypothetical protein